MMAAARRLLRGDAHRSSIPVGPLAVLAGRRLPESAAAARALHLETPLASRPTFDAAKPRPIEGLILFCCRAIFYAEQATQSNPEAGRHVAMSRTAMPRSWRRPRRSAEWRRSGMPDPHPKSQDRWSLKQVLKKVPVTGGRDGQVIRRRTTSAVRPGHICTKQMLCRSNRVGRQAFVMPRLW
jgi:hypothetical protein